MVLKVTLLVLFMTLPIGLPPWAANKDASRTAPTTAIDDASVNPPESKDSRDGVAEDTKRKQDLSRVLLLWLLHNHPLQ